MAAGAANGHLSSTGGSHSAIGDSCDISFALTSGESCGAASSATATATSSTVSTAIHTAIGPSPCTSRGCLLPCGTWLSGGNARHRNAKNVRWLDYVAQQVVDDAEALAAVQSTRARRSNPAGHDGALPPRPTRAHTAPRGMRDITVHLGCGSSEQQTTAPWPRIKAVWDLDQGGWPPGNSGEDVGTDPARDSFVCAGQACGRAFSVRQLEQLQQAARACRDEDEAEPLRVQPPHRPRPRPALVVQLSASMRTALEHSRPVSAVHTVPRSNEEPPALVIVPPMSLGCGADLPSGHSSDESMYRIAAGGRDLWAGWEDVATCWTPEAFAAAEALHCSWRSAADSEARGSDGSTCSGPRSFRSRSRSSHGGAGDPAAAFVVSCRSSSSTAVPQTTQSLGGGAGPPRPPFLGGGSACSRLEAAHEPAGAMKPGGPIDPRVVAKSRLQRLALRFASCFSA